MSTTNLFLSLIVFVLLISGSISKKLSVEGYDFHTASLSTYSPRKVLNLQKEIVKISSNSHTLLLTKDNELYGYGDNEVRFFFSF